MSNAYFAAEGPQYAWILGPVRDAGSIPPQVSEPHLTWISLGGGRFKPALSTFDWLPVTPLAMQQEEQNTGAGQAS